VDNVKITPQEAKIYWDKIPKDSLPFYESELEIGQIIIYPKASRELELYILGEMNNYRKQLENKVTDFCVLAKQVSEDPGSKDKGGLYEDVPSGKMTPPFNDYIFLNPTGSKGIVKTEFGFHYIEILSQKGSGPAYKVGYLPKEILSSQETDNKAQEEANQFAGDSRDLKSFEANFEKNLKPKGFVKGIATEIKPADAQVQGVGLARGLVRNIYEAKQGEVLKPERAGEAYIVAVVTDILKEGTQSAAKARPMVEPLLRNKKKAEMLKQKIGKVTTLETAAAALGGKPIETIDSVRMNGSQSNAIG